MSTTYDVVATTEDGKRVEARAESRRGTLDLDLASGGQGTFLNPDESLLAALGGCTAMTLHLYAARKGWTLGPTAVRLRMVVGKRGEAVSVTQDVEIDAALPEDQRQRLEEIAGRCPVHRLLESTFEFRERLKAEASDA